MDTPYEITLQEVVGKNAELIKGIIGILPDMRDFSKSTRDWIFLADKRAKEMNSKLDSAIKKIAALDERIENLEDYRP